MYEININITLDSCHFLGINLLSIMLLKLIFIFIIPLLNLFYQPSKMIKV